MSNLFLLFYISAWGGLLYFHHKHTKYFGPCSMIMSLYFMWSIMSFILYNSGWFPQKYFYELTLFPFIYLYLMLVVALWPSIMYERANVEKIQKPSISLIKAFFALYIIATIISLPETLESIENNLFLLLTDDDAGVEIYMEKTQGSGHGTLSSIIGPFSAIHNIFKDTSVFILFYYLTLKEKKLWVVLIMLVIFILSMVSAVAAGGRTKFVLLFFSMMVSYFTFYKYWPQNTLRKIKKILLLFIFIVSVPFMALTFSRFGDRTDSGGMLGGLVDYTGQAPLVFNQYALDAGGTRDGDRTATIFKKMLGYDVPEDFWEGRTKHSIMKVSDHDFTTFAGDFVLDFGPEVAPIIFLIFSCLFIILTRPRNHTITFHRLYLLYFAMCVCAQGSQFLYPYSYKDGMVIFGFIFTYIIFVFDYNSHKGRKYQYICINQN